MVRRPILGHLTGRQDMNDELASHGTSPFTTSPTPSPSPCQPIMAPWPRRRLLLADDSVPIRECLTELLRRLDYEVVHVGNGEQVLERLAAAEDAFDLLLLDLNMPELDGWGTLKQLSVRHPALPVIVITAQANQRDWMEALGARALLEKPLDLPLLSRLIEALTNCKPQPVRVDGQRSPLLYGRPRRVVNVDAIQSQEASGMND